MILSITKKQLIKLSQYFAIGFASLSLGFVAYYIWDSPFQTVWKQNDSLLSLALVAFIGFVIGMYKGEADGKRKKMMHVAAILASLIAINLLRSSFAAYTTASILMYGLLVAAFGAIIAYPFVRHYVGVLKQSRQRS